MQTLSEILKTSREGMGLTLRQVEESIGVSNAYLSQLENGKIKKPSANVLYKLATLYGVKLDYLLGAGGFLGPLTDKEASKLLGPYEINSEEEQQLMEFLGWLRFKGRR